MHLTNHSLRQIDEAYLRSLDLEALRGLSLRLLADLKEARERLNRQANDRSPPRNRQTASERQHNRAVLAKAIETCEQRGHSPWRYIEQAIADQRAGRPLAPMPKPKE